VGDAADGKARGDVREEQEGQRLDRAAAGLWQHQPDEVPDRGGPDGEPRPDPETGPADAPQPDAEMQARPDDRADGRAEDAQLFVQQDGTQHEPGVVQQRRDPVEEEPPLGDQNFAQYHRCREDDRGRAHDPEQVGIGGTPLGVEAAGHEFDGHGGRDEQDGGHKAHRQDRERQDRLPECTSGWLALASKRGEDRDERGGEAARDDEPERQLGNDERSVEDVEVSRVEGARELPVADQAHRVAAERQDGQQERASRDEPVEQAQDGRERRGRARLVVRDGSSLERRLLAACRHHDGRGRVRATVSASVARTRCVRVRPPPGRSTPRGGR
jgi:hypothetical protein